MLISPTAKALTVIKTRNVRQEGHHTEDWPNTSWEAAGQSVVGFRVLKGCGLMFSHETGMKISTNTQSVRSVARSKREAPSSLLLCDADICTGAAAAPLPEAALSSCRNLLQSNRFYLSSWGSYRRTLTEFSLPDPQTDLEGLCSSSFLHRIGNWVLKTKGYMRISLGLLLLYWFLTEEPVKNDTDAVTRCAYLTATSEPSYA